MDRWTIRTTRRQRECMTRLKDKLGTENRSEIVREAMDVLEAIRDAESVILIGSDGVHRQFWVQSNSGIYSGPPK